MHFKNIMWQNFCLSNFFCYSFLGRLLHLHSYHSVPAQGKLPLPGLPKPRLQQKSGRPAEWHVPLWKVWQRVSQLQVPPHPFCKWLITGFPKTSTWLMHSHTSIYANAQILDAFSSCFVLSTCIVTCASHYPVFLTRCPYSSFCLQPRSPLMIYSL